MDSDVLLELLTASEAAFVSVDGVEAQMVLLVAEATEAVVVKARAVDVESVAAAAITRHARLPLLFFLDDLTLLTVRFIIVLPNMAWSPSIKSTLEVCPNLMIFCKNLLGCG